jgi:hypothetical protein
METSWESELATLLTDLLAVQDELLGTLTRKRQLLVNADSDGLTAIGRQEEQLIGRLQECLRRREALLARAAREGLPSASIRALSRALPRAGRGPLEDRVRLAGSRARLLKHHSFTNWVLAQRTLIHLSQMLEIIATGGRLQPTYGGGEPAAASGALVDRAA